MSQEVGGALGVAIAGSIALTHAKSLLRTGHTSAAAFTAGYALGFGVIAGVAAAGVVVALLAIPSHVSVGPAAGVGVGAPASSTPRAPLHRDSDDRCLWLGGEHTLHPEARAL